MKATSNGSTLDYRYFVRVKGTKTDDGGQRRTMGGMDDGSRSSKIGGDGSTAKRFLTDVRQEESDGRR